MFFNHYLKLTISSMKLNTKGNTLLTEKDLGQSIVINLPENKL